jgi:hypothetical protein
MLTTLTILSLDQGKIYSPPPDQLHEVAETETNSFSRIGQIVPTGKTAGIVFDWLPSPTFDLRRAIYRMVSLLSFK